MARSVSGAGTKRRLVLKEVKRTYTSEPGTHGRGEATHLYDCSCCLDGDHSTCEKYEMIFCRCWRTKHTDPPAVRGRARLPIKKNAPYYREIHATHEDNGDEFEWEDA